MAAQCRFSACSPRSPPPTVREPHNSPLYKMVQAHLGTFLAWRLVPGYVRRAFLRFLDCGVLAEGFVRVRCCECKEELLVAHSCKGEPWRAPFQWKGRCGFCPSCTARRGAETAAHLVDDVLPHVPRRLLVLALPFDLHLRAARDAQVQSALLTLFVEDLREILRGLTNTGDEAQSHEGRQVHGGSVTFVQLFGSKPESPCSLLSAHHRDLALHAGRARSGDARRRCLAAGIWNDLPPGVRRRLKSDEVAPDLSTIEVNARILAGPRQLAFAANAVAPFPARGRATARGAARRSSSRRENRPCA